MSISHHPQNFASPKTKAYFLPIDVQAQGNLQGTPTLMSGMGLRTLSRAAEYLTTSRNYSDRASDGFAEGEATHILLRLGREIFDDYPTTSARQAAMKRWLPRKTLVRALGGA